MVALIFSGMVPLTFGEPYIQNDQQYIGNDGTLHIVGEIKNNLEYPLNQINVQAILLDEDKRQIATEETRSLVNTVMPGMKGPFDLILTGYDSKDIRSYSLELDYRISHPKNQVIDITESEISMDRHNNMMITGIVSNKGEITANTVAVIATFYDKEGKVTAVSRVHPEPDYLRAEDDAFFLVAIQDKGQAESVYDYTLVAESEEYAAVPEFPIGTLVLLGGTLSTYIGITRYSSIVTVNRIFAINPK